MSQITSLYTDGACSGNPGPGGWGAIAYFDDGSLKELGGADRQTTNNRMEMQAAIGALEFFLSQDGREACILHTDSEYLIKGITQWVKGWKKKGWKTAAGKDVLNQDLWEQLDNLDREVQKITQAPITWKYVRGHAGNVGNERCDTIARGFSQGRPPQLRSRREKSTLPIAEPVTEPVTEAITMPTIESSPPPSTVSNSYQNSATPTASLEEREHAEVEKSREERVAHLQQTIAALRVADEVAQQGYFITSSELADLMDVNASAVTSRGDSWAWRNWSVSRVRREGNQILWQLERADGK
jgi:ribonuclease HI